MTLAGPTLRFNQDSLICLAGAAMAATLDDVPVPYWEAVPIAAGQVADARTHRRPRPAHLSRRAPRLRCAALSRQPLDLHARPLRRARRSACCAPATCCACAPTAPRGRRSTRCPSRSCPQLTREWTLGVLYGPHGAPDFFTDDDIATLLDARLRGALQQRPHRRPPDRSQAALGARRRRRGGAASVEHPRQRLRGRHPRLHRRHADHARSRRPEPRRLRLPGDRRPGRAVEDRPARARRHRALPPDGSGRGRGVADAQDRRILDALEGAAPSAPVATSARAPIQQAPTERRLRDAGRADHRHARGQRRDGLPPARRRRLPARRVRAAAARPDSALPGARA